LLNLHLAHAVSFLPPSAPSLLFARSICGALAENFRAMLPASLTGGSSNLALPLSAQDEIRGGRRWVQTHFVRLYETVRVRYCAAQDSGQWQAFAGESANRSSITPSSSATPRRVPRAQG
jgi:hypothetical protein